jgi:hypothetical protein
LGIPRQLAGRALRFNLFGEKNRQKVFPLQTLMQIVLNKKIQINLTLTTTVTAKMSILRVFKTTINESMHCRKAKCCA